MIYSYVVFVLKIYTDTLYFLFRAFRIYDLKLDPRQEPSILSRLPRDQFVHHNLVRWVLFLILPIDFFK